MRSSTPPSSVRTTYCEGELLPIGCDNQRFHVLLLCVCLLSGKRAALPSHEQIPLEVRFWYLCRSDNCCGHVFIKSGTR